MHITDGSYSFTFSVKDFILCIPMAVEYSGKPVSHLAASHLHTENVAFLLIFYDQYARRAISTAGLLYLAQNYLAVGIHYQLASACIDQAVGHGDCQG